MPFFLSPDGVQRLVSLAEYWRQVAPSPATELMILGWGYYLESWSMLSSLGQPVPGYGLGR
jgi:hypothetical protein